MKKNYFLTLILAFTVVFVSSAQVTELFISKYAEGSSNNKFLEIYNGQMQPLVFQTMHFLPYQMHPLLLVNTNFGTLLQMEQK
jgi:predicted extracellular nuclease